MYGTCSYLFIFVIYYRDKFPLNVDTSQRRGFKTKHQQFYIEAQTNQEKFKLITAKI